MPKQSSHAGKHAVLTQEGEREGGKRDTIADKEIGRWERQKCATHCASQK